MFRLQQEPGGGARYGRLLVPLRMMWSERPHQDLSLYGVDVELAERADLFVSMGHGWRNVARRPSYAGRAPATPSTVTNRPIPTGGDGESSTRSSETPKKTTTPAGAYASRTGRDDVVSVSAGDVEIEGSSHPRTTRSCGAVFANSTTRRGGRTRLAQTATCRSGKPGGQTCDAERFDTEAAACERSASVRAIPDTRSEDQARRSASRVSWKTADHRSSDCACRCAQGNMVAVLPSDIHEMLPSLRKDTRSTRRRSHARREEREQQPARGPGGATRSTGPACTTRSCGGRHGTCEGVTAELIYHGRLPAMETVPQRDRSRVLVRTVAKRRARWNRWARQLRGSPCTGSVNRGWSTAVRRHGRDGAEPQGIPITPGSREVWPRLHVPSRHAPALRRVIGSRSGSARERHRDRRARRVPPVRSSVPCSRDQRIYKRLSRPRPGAPIALRCSSTPTRSPKIRRSLQRTWNHKVDSRRRCGR